MGTLIVGARCGGGVVLVADRRQLAPRTYELAKPGSKLLLVRGFVVGVAGTRAFVEKAVRLLDERLEGVTSLAQALVIAEEVASDVQERSGEVLKELFGEERVMFPLAGLEGVTSGKARLYSVLAGAASDETDYAGWGIGERYAELGRLFFRLDASAEEAWKALVLLVAMAERINLAIGDGVDVVILRDGVPPAFLHEAEVNEVLAKARFFLDDLPAFIRDRLHAQRG